MLVFRNVSSNFDLLCGGNDNSEPKSGDESRKETNSEAREKLPSKRRFGWRGVRKKET